MATHIKKLHIAFQGSRGSFSEQAVEQYFGEEIHRHPLRSFYQTFEIVAKKQCDYAVVPIENTLIGTVFDSFDNFLQFPSIRIIANTTLRIVHSLLGLPNAKISTINTIYSQLPGIGQCQDYLARHKHWSVVPFRDTAAAARHVAHENNIHNAAIASKKAAEIYKLKILKKGIESSQHNYTRFAVISHKDTVPQNTTRQIDTSHHGGFVIFSVKNETGALLHCLEIFMHHNINLLKIESRPIIGKPWKYQFVAELEYDPAHTKIQHCLDDMNKLVVSFHIIGIFPKTNKA